MKGVIELLVICRQCGREDVDDPDMDRLMDRVCSLAAETMFAKRTDK